MSPAKFAKLIDQLHAAEHKLMRAARKWDRLRASVRRAEKALDKDFIRRAKIGGAMNWTQFAEGAK